MSSKFGQRCWFWLIWLWLGLGISCLINWQHGLVVAAVEPIKSIEIVTQENVTKLEAQGQELYHFNQFQSAINIWQQVYQLYLREEDTLGQGRVLGNLALAYGQLNNWQQATANIDASLKLLTSNEQATQDRLAVLAQVQNNHGILLLQKGQTEAAIAVWEQAQQHYQQTDNQLGLIRVAVNQASAFKQLGLYRRAVNTLSEIESNLLEQPDSLLKTTGLRSYGDILGLIGEVKHSQKVLTTSLETAVNLNNASEQAKTLLILGNTYQNQNPSQALEIYDRALETCNLYSECEITALPLQLNLAKLNLFLDNERWQDISELIEPITDKFAILPSNRANIDRKINFARSLIRLQTQVNIPLSDALSLSKIEIWLADTIQQAKAIDYRQAESYGWGLWGQIEAELNHWQQAQKYTQQALLFAQQLNAPEIIYLWQWQLGRIETARGDRSTAIAHYSRSVELLKSLSQDLVAINPNVQYSFRESVEPVYRQLVSLLLTSNDETETPQANLEGARKVIESLQLAELNNFFREACLEAQTTDIDNLDPNAAIIYPIILEDRLEVIVSLPHQPLQHYQTAISRPKLEAIIEQMRQTIVVRSRRNFYAPASQLYDLLIRPVLAELQAKQIKTLVFVPDGSFRNIPLTALYDGRQYLIENYNVALTPGLQLLSPRPLKQIKLRAIAAGLTTSRQGFSALNYVDEELQEIEQTAQGEVLLNQEFTSETLQQKIQVSDYPIVHIATHGQFSSSLEDTFLLTWNDRLSINQLDNILQDRNLRNQKAIELLVLSACETATGDKRAALGMAGMAVRAGAKSTVATLWSVNDRSTSKLMKDFYHQLADQHLPKAEAMRQAQLSLLKDRGYAHPFYWSPYILLGNWL